MTTDQKYGTIIPMKSKTKDFGLAELFLHLGNHEEVFTGPHLHSYETFTARNLIEQKFGIKLSLAEVYKLIYEEGLAPAKDYGIPKWYIDKHMTPVHVKQRRAEVQASGDKRDPMWKPWKRYKEFRDGQDIQTLS